MNQPTERTTRTVTRPRHAPSRALRAVAPLLLLTLAVVLAQGAGEISFRTEIYQVREVTNADGSTGERLVATTSAVAGQTIEYRVYAKNSSSGSLSAGTVQIVGPIPQGMTYVADSATVDDDRYITEYSVDGRNFSEPHVVVGEGSNRRVADPSEYTTIRWTVLVEMAPGQEEEFIYRVVLDE